MPAIPDRPDRPTVAQHHAMTEAKIWHAGDRVELGPGDDVALILDGREVARIAVRDLLP